MRSARKDEIGALISIRYVEGLKFILDLEGILDDVGNRKATDDIKKYLN